MSWIIRSQFAPSARPPSGRYLSFAERGEIALLRVQGQGVREIARRSGRRRPRSRARSDVTLPRAAAASSTGPPPRSGTPTVRLDDRSRPVEVQQPVRRRVDVAPGEVWDVAALGNRDDDRILLPGGDIVAVEIASQATGLDAHDRVGLRIKIVTPTEHGARDGGSLQSVRSTGKGFFHDEAEQFAPGGLACKSGAARMRRSCARTSSGDG